MTTVFQNFFFFFYFLLWALRYVLYLISKDWSPNADHSLLKFLWFSFWFKIHDFLENLLCAVLTPPGVLISCWLLKSLSFSSSSTSGFSFSPWRPDSLMWVVIVHCLLPGAQVQMLKYFVGPPWIHLKEVSCSPFSTCTPGLRGRAPPAAQAG